VASGLEEVSVLDRVVSHALPLQHEGDVGMVRFLVRINDTQTKPDLGKVSPRPISQQSRSR
jgi:hypothetical protein